MLSLSSSGPAVPSVALSRVVPPQNIPENVATGLVFDSVDDGASLDTILLRTSAGDITPREWSATTPSPTITGVITTFRGIWLVHYNVVMTVANDEGITATLFFDAAGLPAQRAATLAVPVTSISDTIVLEQPANRVITVSVTQLNSGGAARDCVIGMGVRLLQTQE